MNTRIKIILLGCIALIIIYVFASFNEGFGIIEDAIVNSVKLDVGTLIQYKSGRFAFEYEPTTELDFGGRRVELRNNKSIPFLSKSKIWRFEYKESKTKPSLIIYDMSKKRVSTCVLINTMEDLFFKCKTVQK